MLTKIKDIPHTVILAGDMNTSGRDLTPTSFKREMKKRFGSLEALSKTAVGLVTGGGLVNNVATAAIKSQAVGTDPTVRSIPGIAMNQEEDVFDELNTRC